MNIEDIQKKFGRILDALEELKTTDPLDLPYEIDCLRNDVEDIRDEMIADIEGGF